MLNNYTDLLPFQSTAIEQDVLQLYSLNRTGVGGRFVVAETGNQNPVLTAGQFSATSVGASYTNTVSLRYENPRKVRYAASGDTKGQIVGLMLYGTVETDNNGQRLILNPNLAKELGVVYSGQTTPIATQGMFTLKKPAYTNTPIPGYVGVISAEGEGKVSFLAPSAAVYSSGLNVCKVLSTSGSAFDGYVQIKLTLD